MRRNHPETPSASQEQSVAAEHVSLLDEQAVLGAHVAAQGVYAAVGGRTVRTEGALWSVRVVVVPPVGHLLAAGLAPPQEDVGGGGLEHLVVGEGRTDERFWQERRPM